METWAIITLVLGSGAISAVLTFFITKMQVSHSDKRLEKELERAKEVDSRERRRGVRGEPLLKLRDELARMAAKHDRVVGYAGMLHTNIGTGATEEEVKKWLNSTLDDWNSYLDTGVFQQVLFTIDDKEIADRVKQLRLKYTEAYIRNIRWEALPPEELRKALRMREELQDEVTEIQSLINKRLEEL